LELNILDGVTTDAGELNYVDGVTSNIQMQLDTKGTVNTLSDLAITSTALELNILDGVTTDAGELNYVDGVTSNIQMQLDTKGTVNTLSDLAITSTASELNILDGVTADAGELNYVDGVTSNIQTQLDGKQGSLSGSATTIDTETLLASLAMVTDSNGKVAVSAVTATELGYVSGVTSNVQTQLNTKGTVNTLSDLSITSTASELNILDGVTADAGELNYVDGVTSSIQTQLDAKQALDADLTDLADGTLSASKVENNEYFITSEGTAEQVWTSDGTGAGAWGSPAAVSITDNESTNEGNALIFAADAELDGGILGLESDGDATYNPSTGTIFATNFSGNLAGTLQTPAQGNVTSLGTLSVLTVDNVITDGAAIGHADDTDLITLADGSVTFTGSTVIPTADINGGAIDGAAIGASSASTGAFTSVTASTSLEISGSTGLILQNEETITNAVDGTVAITATTTALSGDLTVTGNDLTFGNGETISNSTDGTVVVTATTIEMAGKTDFADNAITGYGADLQTLSGTSKTLAASDNGTVIVCSSGSATTITVPTGLPAGFNCMIVQTGSGQVTFNASSTTLNNRNGLKTAAQYAMMTLVNYSSNTFVVSGDTVN
jgi:hypothetical protein